MDLHHNARTRTPQSSAMSGAGTKTENRRFSPAIPSSPSWRDHWFIEPKTSKVGMN